MAGSRTWQKRSTSSKIEGYIVFHNATKGEKASGVILEQTFDTGNEEEVVKIIFEKGALQLTQAQRKKLLKDKIDEIINFIHIHCINPQTNKPHPPARIESAMDEAGVNVDYVLPPDKQANKLALGVIGPYTGMTATLSLVRK